MTRALPIAASIALAAFALVAFAQTPPAAPATDMAAPAAEQTPVQAAPQQAVPPQATATPTTAAAAAPAPAPALIGSAERGKRLTYTCEGCHGVPGYKNAYPNYHVPRIGGQSTQYLTNALNEYRKGARKHPTMQAQAESFSEQDIADIAAFLSELKQ